MGARRRIVVRRDENDRRVAALPDAPRRLDAVHAAGKADVHQHQIDVEIAGLLDRALAIRHEDGGMRLDLDLPAADALFQVVARVRRMLDLDADPARIANELRHDPLLAARLTRRPGLRLPGAWDGFECAVRAIVGQQVSVRAATTVTGRIARAFGRPSGSDDPALSHVFPDAAALRDAPLESIGLIADPGCRQPSARTSNWGWNFLLPFDV